MTPAFTSFLCTEAVPISGLGGNLYLQGLFTITVFRLLSPRLSPRNFVLRSRPAMSDNQLPACKNELGVTMIFFLLIVFGQEPPLLPLPELGRQE
jgi:hypothetical protein